MKIATTIYSILLFSVMSFQTRGQEICNLHSGFSITEVGDQTIILEGDTFWYSEDEVCWEPRTFPEITSTPREIAFFNENEGIITTDENFFYTSIDGGESWEELPYLVDNIQEDTYSSFHLKLIDSTSILINDRFGERFLVSNNKGETWRSIKQYGSFDGTPVTVETVDRDTWYIATQFGLLRTDDQGITHDTLHTISHHLVEKDDDSGMLISVGKEDGKNTLLLSDDEFETFEAIDLETIIPSNGWIHEFALADSVLYLFSNNMIYYSLDFGRTWEVPFQEQAGLTIKTTEIDQDVYVHVTTEMIKLNCSLPQCTATSINAELSVAELSVYPNPTSGELTLNSEVDEVMVYNNLGHLIQRESCSSRQININNLNSGIYLLGLWNGDTVVYEKIVKL